MRNIRTVEKSEAELKPFSKIAKNVFPCKGNEAKTLFPEDFLTSFERTEVEEFEEVWYLASKEKKYAPTKLERLVNNGFDD